jgi:hypothetical protein
MITPEDFPLSPIPAAPVNPKLTEHEWSAIESTLVNGAIAKFRNESSLSIFDLAANIARIAYNRGANDENRAIAEAFPDLADKIRTIRRPDAPRRLTPQEQRLKEKGYTDDQIAGILAAMGK